MAADDLFAPRLYTATTTLLINKKMLICSAMLALESLRMRTNQLDTTRPIQTEYELLNIQKYCRGVRATGGRITEPR